MSERVPIDPERLLAQTAWVRRLARSLARDEASADDLVQESFVAALRRPPTGAHDEPRLRAWFGFVLRNMAFRRSRGEARREERERRGADEHRTDSDERADELEELRAELFKHVKALSELSREVVLLRYFEELDSAQIAKRLGLPDSTVRNRLRRALAELRERLARKHGSDWRNLCFFALPSTGAKVAAGGGTLAAAGGGLWIAGGGVAAVVLAALALLWWNRGSGLDPQSDHAALAALPVEIQPAAGETLESTLHVAEPPPASSARTSEPGSLHVRVLESYEPPPSSPYAHGIIVHGSVRDEKGEPLEGISLDWTDSWGRRRDTRTEEGKYSANSFAPGVHVVLLRGHECAEARHEITIAPEPELQAFDFVERRAHIVPIYVLDPDGDNLLDSESGKPALSEGCGTVVGMHRPPTSGMDLSAEPGASHPEWSMLLWSWELKEPVPPGAFGLLQIGGEPPYYVGLLHMGRVVATQRFEVIPEAVTFQVERSNFEHAPIVESTRRTFLTTPDGTKEVFPPGVLAPATEPGAPMHLQFLDAAARPVMAYFMFCSARDPSSEIEQRYGGIVWPGGVFNAGAHADGTYDWDGLLPGSYVLHVAGTRNDDDPTFERLGALPRRVDLRGGPDANEILVQMSPLRTVLLRSRCAADESFRWEISTCDGLPVIEGTLIGHAPLSLGLPAGKFVLRVRARPGDTLLAEQTFEIGEKPLVLELAR